eukprot:c20892_g1_i1.p1 GENE.c20892_g1_i1~~c20892_g1_i1.p1  ORF type:complete len:222 (+),score=61.31 c20892_g1_i1:2-667(+)
MGEKIVQMIKAAIALVVLFASVIAVPLNEAKPATLSISAAETKEQALNQVLSFISEMAQPLTPEEHKSLESYMATGNELLVQAENKARQMPETQTLVQTEVDAPMFGLKEDGTIDAEAAATQVTDLLSKLAAPVNPLTEAEKTMLHELISGFARAFAPTKETTETLQKDFEQLVDGVVENSKDQLLGATTLLAVFADSNQALHSEFTNKFLDTMEKQFLPK